jgi:hypothetical protein
MFVSMFPFCLYFQTMAVKVQSLYHAVSVSFSVQNPYPSFYYLAKQSHRRSRSQYVNHQIKSGDEPVHVKFMSHIFSPVNVASIAINEEVVCFLPLPDYTSYCT